jgi:E3 SUMO-protein ligase NSE2
MREHLHSLSFAKTTMPSRRSLLSRQQRNAGSQVQLSRQNPQPTALPPYEPPSCPLTESAKRSLASITSNHGYRTLKKHLDAAVKNITEFAADSNDCLYQSKEKVRKMAQNRGDAQDDSEKTESEEAAEQRAWEMEEKVESLTAESEKALRDLTDYKQELAQQGDHRLSNLRVLQLILQQQPQ